ncbi:MAG: hypothetical protein CM15mP49_06380 [Actinomycetota bacterium]|nr:MAG: hypothetical protein CM15mP49_06380 [Actinomycetota bacterium]
MTVDPGAMQFTLTPDLHNSAATFFVSPTTPCLAAAYTWGPSPPVTPAVLAMLIIDPDFCFPCTGLRV